MMADMTRDWTSQFTIWAQPPSAAEVEKMERAKREITAAIGASATLAPHVPRVYPQGSFYNRTHVARESDVDVRVVPTDVFFTDWELVDPRAPFDIEVREALDESIGNFNHPYTFDEFRADVGAALTARFGPPPAVTPGDKVFNIHETRLQVESDCLPAYEVRLYQPDYRTSPYVPGIAFLTRRGERIENYPEHQHRNGVAKHERTFQRFKKMVRILKNLRFEMDDEHVAAAKDIPSFLIECLVWNVPDHLFNRGDYFNDMRLVLAFLIVDTGDAAKTANWREENDIKYLFHPKQPWTLKQAHDFLAAAWAYVGYTA